MIVDGMHGTCPEPTKDIHFKDVVPKAFFYTAASDRYRLATSYKGSTHGLKVGTPDLMLTDEERKWHEEAFLSTLELEESPLEEGVGLREDQGNSRKPQDTGSQEDSDTLVDFKDVRLQIGSGEDQRNTCDKEQEEGSKSQKKKSQKAKDTYGEIDVGVSILVQFHQIIGEFNRLP